MVERAIQTVKGLIRKISESNTSIPPAILEYNNTPKHGLPAPCELIMGRKLRTLPCAKALLIPKYDVTNLLKNLENKFQKYAKYYNQATRILTDLDPQQPVLIQNGIRNWTRAKIMDKCQEPDSYVLRREDGVIARRNRIHLRPLRREEETVTPNTTQINSSTRVEDSYPQVGESVSAGESVGTDESEKEVELTEERPSRPKREIRKPSHLKDFHVY